LVGHFASGRARAADHTITHAVERMKPHVMDTKTEEWPIPAKHKAEFESMKFGNMACLLRVYRDNVFAEPGNVNEALTDTVVEVYFTIRHFYMREEKFDTFQADIQQIKNVKPGASIATSGFKRRNARDGPLEIVKMARTTGNGKEERRGDKRARTDGDKQ
jgi:hypothetical protein